MTWMFSRVSFWNPDSSNTSLYAPLGSAGNKNLPSGCVTVVCTPISAGDVALTVTPGRIAPCASVTSPVNRPGVICADADAAPLANARTNTTAFHHLMSHPQTFVEMSRDSSNLDQRWLQLFAKFYVSHNRSSRRCDKWSDVPISQQSVEVGELSLQQAVQPLAVPIQILG